MEDVNKIRLQRERLIDAFQKFSRRDGRQIPDVDFDEDEIMRFGTIFLRGHHSRTFAVDLVRDRHRGHEALIKREGENYDISCLNLFIPYENVKYEEIWQMYLAWIQENRSENEMASMINSFDDKKY